MNNYDGFDLDKIYANGGTYADQGKNGIPMMQVEFDLPLYNAQHAMVALLTGDNALNPKDWNDIEPRDGITNVQPGELNVPLNTDFFTISYVDIFKNSAHEKNLRGTRILEFKIVNGEKILTYNINNTIWNQILRVITQRESDPPVISIKQSADPDSLLLTIRDANLKSVWYTINGGGKIILMTEVLEPVTEKKVAVKMGLTYGNYSIVVGADDYFRLTSQTTIQRNLVNAPPVINVTSPVEGKIYDTKNLPHTLKIPFKVSVVEKEYKSGYYSFDGGKTKVTMKQSEDRNLTLPDGSDFFPDGNYTMTIYAQDNYNLEATKTIKFSVGNVTGIDKISPDSKTTVYPNPTTGVTTITYPAGCKAVINLFDASGNMINRLTDEDQDGETVVNVKKYSSGVIYYQVKLNNGTASSTNTYSGKLIIKQ